MRDCKSYRKAFIEALYDEMNPDQRRNFDAHLESCEDCAAAYAKLKSALGIMGKREREEPEDVFWTGYWDRLADRLESPEKISDRSESRWKRLVQTLTVQPTWAYGTAAAVGLLIIGVFIGKLVYGPSTGDKRGIAPIPIAESSPQSAEMTALDQRTERYLNRSKVLLLGLINFDAETEDPYTLNLPQQRDISQNLVEEAGYLKSELSESADNKLLQLITDLEVILLQIANLESEYDLSAVDMVKSGVDRRGILLKINLEEMQRADRQADRSTKSDGERI
jgi:hypothetical protein